MTVEHIATPEQFARIDKYLGAAAENGIIIVTGPGGTLTVTNTSNLTRERIIKHFTDNIKDYQKLAKNIAGLNDYEDLFSECTLMLLEMPEEKIKAAWNDTQALKPFFLRVLMNQYRSETSRYYKQYRKQNALVQKKGADIVYNDQRTEQQEEEAHDAADVLNARAQVHALNGEMFPNELEELCFNLYVQEGSLRKALAAIPEQYQSRFDLKEVHRIVKKFRRTIKSKLNGKQ